MATRRQRQRKLARAQFHSAQCKERNRSGRRFVKTYDEPAHERRSAVIGTAEQSAKAGETVSVKLNDHGLKLAALTSMSRDELRKLAATAGIRGRSIMTKDALVKALAATHS